MADPTHVLRARKLAIHLGADAAHTVGELLQRQNPTHLPMHQRNFDGGAIGWIGGEPPPADGAACVFAGVPLGVPDAAYVRDANDAATLFAACDGAFAGMYFDAASNTVVIATDCLGMQPLYMRRAGQALTVVSETKAMDAAPDAAAWGAFISLGHPIAQRSLVNDLARVPPASILRWNGVHHRLDVRRYWEWPQPSDAWRDYDFLGALAHDVQRYAGLGDPGTLLLSGGFDSRLLLFLLRQAEIPVEALIVAHADEHGDADGRLATAVARRARVPFAHVQPPLRFFSSAAYLDYLVASDVGYPSLDLFIAKVASHISHGPVWDGLVPGFAFMPLHQSAAGFPAYLEHEIKGPGSGAWRAAEAVFAPDAVAAMRDGFAEDLRTELARLPSDAYGLTRFVVENRSRNRPAMNPLKVYANRCPAYIPGLSKEFMAHAATIPFVEKRDARLYRRLFAALDPRALQLPLISGGELLPGTHRDPRYLVESWRGEIERFRTRHPSLLPPARRGTAPRSTFLDRMLLEEDDAWLNPYLHDTLATPDAGNYAVWKLLLHWKAWRWVHEGRLKRMLGPLATE